MTKHRAEKCPSDTVTRPYKLLVSLLCGDDEMEVRRDSIPERVR